MANENGNFRRCGQIGDGDDDEVSLIDVLNEEARLQADANAVLGGSDANNCTYPQGYLKRQALYACATCTPNGNAGICLACSYACHEGHDLHELYTKRYFACDCGNEKFGGQECKLYKEKKKLNARNHYNQNFVGVYCTCARPYPDLDDTVDDEMIQCIICEDWYHGRHLKTTIPESDDFEEMICSGCMSRYPFLWAYNVASPAVTVMQASANDETETVDVTGSEDKKTGLMNGCHVTQEITSPMSLDNTDSVPLGSNFESQQQIKLNTSEPTNSQANTEPLSGIKRELHGNRPSDQNAQEPTPKKMRVEELNGKQCGELPGSQNAGLKDTAHEDGQCLLKSLQKRVIDCPDSAAFWPSGWRSKLCQCGDCMDMYKDRELEYLIDELDTVHEYEEKGHNSASNVSEEESEASVLASMNRVQQIEIVRGLLDLKTELNEFLQGFATEGKVVTETDVREFFQRMDQRRRERLHIPQYSCQ